jgi:hypothetical protein
MCLNILRSITYLPNPVVHGAGHVWGKAPRAFRGSTNGIERGGGINNPGYLYYDTYIHTILEGGMVVEELRVALWLFFVSSVVVESIGWLLKAVPVLS